MYNWRLTLGILTTSTILMSASYTMLIPFLPMYLIEALGVQTADVNWWSSIIFSCTFVISGIMAPIWGALADRKSRKLMALRAAFCLSISYLLGAFVQGPWELFWLRIFQGFSAGLWPATLAIMSAQAPKQRLGLCMGVMQAALTAGGVLGPLIGGLLAEFFGMRSTFMLAGGALFLITLVLAFCVKDKQTPKPQTQATKASGRALLRTPVIQRMLLTAGVCQMTVLMTQPVLPMYIAELYGQMEGIVLIAGIVFSIVGISGVIASPCWGILGQSWGFRPVLYLSLFFSGIFGVVQAIPDTLTSFTVLRFIGGLAFAGIFPAINAVITQSTDPSDRGRVFGYSYAAQQFGCVLGPLAGGVLATYCGNHAVIAASGAVLFPLVALLYLRRPKQASPASGSPIDHK